jgi:hypothetical protein
MISKSSRQNVKRIGIFTTLVAISLGYVPGSAIAAESPLNLGSAASYGILANTTITAALSSSVSGTAGGDVGVGSATSPTGTLTQSGSLVLGGTSITALTSAAAALADNRSGLTTVVELGAGRVITPGAYVSGELGITGTLTLDAVGDPNAVFIFRAATTLTTASSSKVILINQAQACNVYWQIGSSATLGTSSTMVGHVIAHASVDALAGANINGQLIGITAAVTLGGNTVVNNDCAAPVVTPVARNSCCSCSDSCCSCSNSGCSCSNSGCNSPGLCRSCNSSSC